jgi:serine phosphatase RsbU (regulator of sigma subunit)/tetratricopeptide (TPR) repeat protein
MKRILQISRFGNLLQNITSGACLIVFLILSLSSVSAQSRKDSLLIIWEDSSINFDERISALDKAVWEYFMYSSPDSAVYYSIRMLELAKNKNKVLQQSWAFNNLSVAFRLIGSYERAIRYSSQNLDIQKHINKPLYLSSALNNHGLIYYYMSNPDQALIYFNRSLDIYKKEKDAAGTALVLSNIALVQTDSRDFEKALKNTLRSLQIRDSIGDSDGKAIALNNIGNIYLSVNQIDKALEYFDEARLLYKLRNNQQGLANTINNSASAFLQKKDLIKAEQYAIEALMIAKNLGVILETRQAADLLFRIYKEKKQFKKALEMHEIYMQMNDSIVKISNQNEILSRDYKVRFQIDSTVSAETEKRLQFEIENQQALLRKAKNEKITLFGGIGLIAIFTLLLYNRFKVSIRQNILIDEKNKTLDAQNKFITLRQNEIADSIRYASRLQEAMLPDIKKLNSFFTDATLFYKPKDVVSGDFYWFEQKDDSLFLAVADCTGHGVPGAMVSMVCYNMLKRAVFEFEKDNPSSILDLTRSMVIEHFSNKDDSIHDGMDIALCRIHLPTLQLSYSGANIPLRLIRKTDNKQYVIENFKGNKQPVGIFMNQIPFDNIDIQLRKEDQIIIYTDGMIDQFGGKDGKKLKTSGLQNFLLSHAEEDSVSFKYSLNQFIYQWQNKHDQVDDMCMIRIRV